MKPSNFNMLCELMETFLEQCDADGGNEGWVHETLHVQMARAASLVYDATVDGQKFAKEQESD